MMVPEYMRFYGQDASQALGEYAKRFFSLINSMYRLQAKEALTSVTVISAAVSGDNNNVISDLQKQERGIHGIVQEARSIKGK